MNAMTMIPLNLDRMSCVRVVALPERFDVYADVDFAVDELTGGTTLLIDGTATRFADLSALQSIVDSRLAALDAGCDLVVGAPSEELLATLELTGFSDLIPVISGSAS